jgi:hypothetical protein
MRVDPLSVRRRIRQIAQVQPRGKVNSGNGLVTACKCDASAAPITTRLRRLLLVFQSVFTFSNLRDQVLGAPSMYCFVAFAV